MQALGQLLVAPSRSGAAWFAEGGSPASIAVAATAEAPTTGALCGADTTATATAASWAGHPEKAVPEGFLGRYEVGTLLGFGGMGVVYQAFDPLLRRDVAVKVMSPAFSSDPGLRRRFEREARVAASVRHPGVVSVYDFGVDDGSPYLVLELVEGRTLNEVLRRGPLPPSEVASIARELASGLAAIHRAGFVHRDIKPSNIMLARDGAVRIIDLGLAAPSGASEADAPSVPDATVPGAVLGTVRYMSPEQARGERLDPRSDQFSMGVVLYEAACGSNPFFRGSLAATIAALLVHEPPPPCSDPALNALIARCLDKRPKHRFQELKDVVERIEKG
jgi:serine/threonine protein kinase